MKKVLALILVGLVVAAGVWFYVNKGHEDVAGEKPELSINATELVKAFETNEQEANKQYVGKLIEVSGKIVQIDHTEDGSVNLLLESDNPMSTVLCQLDPLQKQDQSGISEGREVRIKGLCSGFTTDVVLDRCHIIR
ncbi:MAG TPA: hypothetical protein PLC76_02090 [Saprospiraceae bacterium]|nr:MAG: OB-fold tRNA/helicase-type nucleic acid binding-protein [Candidatus Parvibacillus calidus]MCC7149087.1 hypothetical protein [Saprospiraceae bacterium]MBK7740819.1 hypothetical protein [Candidatus Parvibacillus calidus]QLH28128.1 MAG: hypothetical protein HWD63_01190 [Candidatus Parvibacillus calidus]HRN34443.1 hypothetical protein [Saprospiraceae bacterium]